MYFCAFKFLSKVMKNKSGFSIKKAIALSFLFLANAVMLAHAVLPHHHHGGLVYFMATAHHQHDCDHYHCDHHHCNDAQSEDGNSDYTPCNDDIEDCELATIYFKFENQRRTFQRSDFDFDLFSFDFALFTDNHTPSIDDDIGLPFRQNPYLLPCHLEYISQSLGLRAPPVC